MDKPFVQRLSLATRGNNHVIDLTGDVRKAIRDSDRPDGVVTVFVPGSTAGITTIEFEPGLEHDISDAFDRLIPEDMNYAHNARWGDGNGHSHIRASLLGPSLTVPLMSGEMTLGTWQHIVLVDFDNRPRKRDVIIQVMG